MRPKTCPSCRTKFEPVRPLQVACSVPCAIAHTHAVKAKRERKEHREAKAKLKTRRDWVKKAQIEFNRYIRERDRGKTCICCDRPLVDDAVGGGFDCGHYRSVGSAPHLRFDERNAHGQTKYCNRYLSGNVAGYRIGLIKRIGIDQVEALESDQSVKKYSQQDLMEIESHYRAKTKQLKKERGRLCTIEGCNKPIHFEERGLCQMHYFRFMRNGSYELKPVKRKERIENPAGYQKIRTPGHLLANSDGYAYEHRLVVYEKYGTNLPPCEICGKPITWKNCHIDHKDNDVRNNKPENLRPLCRPCNTTRDYPPQHSIRGNKAISHNGQTMTAQEWARQPDVNVTGATIKRRLSAGMSVNDALYAEKKTHKLKGT